MSLIVKTELISIPEDANAEYRIKAEVANNSVNQMADSLNNSQIKELDPQDGRKAIITIKADVDKGVIIERDYQM